jgi:Rrf2 family cysteine metabolism transcriptional repressor
MKFSTKVRYGLRGMIELACRYGQGPIQLGTVADNQQISAKYLHAVMQQLRIAGLVRTVRGAHGGFELNRDPSKITVLEVIEAIDGPIAVVDCVVNDCAFLRASPCVANEVWCDITTAIREVIEAQTLADLAARVRCPEGEPLEPPCP